MGFECDCGQRHVCGDHRTTLWRWLFPSTLEQVTRLEKAHLSAGAIRPTCIYDFHTVYRSHVISFLAFCGIRFRINDIIY